MSEQVLVDPHAGVDVEIPDPFERSTDDDGLLHAVSPQMQITVIPDGEESARMFNRVAVQPFRGLGKKVLVCELNGVRLYVDGNHLVMTTQKMNP